MAEEAPRSGRRRCRRRGPRRAALGRGGGWVRGRPRALDAEAEEPRHARLEAGRRPEGGGDASAAGQRGQGAIGWREVQGAVPRTHGVEAGRRRARPAARRPGGGAPEATRRRRRRLGVRRVRPRAPTCARTAPAPGRAAALTASSRAGPGMRRRQRCRSPAACAAEEQHAGAPRTPTGRAMAGSRSGAIWGRIFGWDFGLREEGDLPPPPSAVGRPPLAAAGVEGHGEGGCWWRRRGRPGVASGATRRRRCYFFRFKLLTEGGS